MITFTCTMENEKKLEKTKAQNFLKSKKSAQPDHFKNA